MIEKRMRKIGSIAKRTLDFFRTEF